MSYTPSPQEQLRSAGLSDAEIALGYEPGDLSDAEVRDLASMAGLKWIEPDGEDGGYPGGFDMASLDDVRNLVARARVITACTATHVNLEGLRDRLLHPGAIVRDEQGYYGNPAWPVTDEDVDFGTLARAFGLELQAAWAESQMTVDAYEAMSDAGHCNDWTPAPPDGDGWVLASIHDAEDGAIAWFVRPGDPTSRHRRAVAQRSDADVADAFIDQVKDKLKRAAHKGRSGWQTTDAQDLRQQMAEHLVKGDPVDVAAYCAFLWSRGDSTKPLRLPLTGSDKALADWQHDAITAMQAAIIEWKHGKGTEAALGWIANTLGGPGLLPDFAAEYGTEAQAWFDVHQSNPFPKCACGRPSHIGWMGQGFCSDKHHREAMAAHNATKPASPDA